MAIIFSEDQRAVIDHRRGNLLVSAAAGSGKTTVMVQRILEMIQDPSEDVSLDQLLVVTFTNAAAASMKEKIEQKLSCMLEKDPGNRKLARELRIVPLSSIMTNHAFSLQIVKDYITRIDGVDPGFRVADETEVALLRADTIRQVLEDFYTRALDTGAEEDFLTFVKC
ncbi:MAG: UvrD-helicase domain-containing protein, partial [Erysipelotrichaceae bacterium]|nr:UvrD-helicase domain-containing protein [Erysipelotrichaceae bacterium]